MEGVHVALSFDRSFLYVPLNITWTVCDDQVNTYDKQITVQHLQKSSQFELRSM